MCVHSICVSVYACVRACVRACMRMYGRANVCTCVVRVCVFVPPSSAGMMTVLMALSPSQPATTTAVTMTVRAIHARSMQKPTPSELPMM